MCLIEGDTARREHNIAIKCVSRWEETTRKYSRSDDRDGTEKKGTKVFRVHGIDFASCIKRSELGLGITRSLYNDQTAVSYFIRRSAEVLT